MDDQPNPYESPQSVSPLELPAELPQPHPRDGWKFVLLGLALLCGLVSFVPWLAVILAVISAPVFVRYFLLRQKSLNGRVPTPDTVFAGVMGGIGLSIGILAAAAGAFLGVCSVTAWGVFLSYLLPQRDLFDVQGALAIGMVLGLGAFLVVTIWLFQRLWPRRNGAGA